MKNRLLFIDILRIVGIALVMIQHIITTSSLGPSLQQFFLAVDIFNIYHICYGNLGVWLFIFASGCSLALNYGDVSTIVKIKNFYAKRSLRLYPVYWAAVFFNLAVFNGVIPALTFTDYARLFSGFQAFFTYTLNDYYGKVNGAFWFIGVIVSLYLLYPVILAMIKRHPHLSLISLLAIEVISRLIMSQIPGLIRGYDWFPLCRVFDFGLGIYLIRTGFYLKTATTNGIIAFMSNISFHVYLIHMPLLVLLNYSVILFMLTTLVISSMLYAFDNTLRQAIGTRKKQALVSK